MGHHGVAVDQPQDHPGHERTEDGLQPEPLGQGHESHQQHHRPADPDLGGGVLETQQHVGQSHVPPGPGHRQSDHGEQQHEHAQQDHAGSRSRGLPRVEQRQQDHRAEVGQGPPGHHQLSELRVHQPGVLEHGNHQPQRGGQEHDGHEAGRTNLSGGLQRRSDGHRQDDGRPEPGTGQPKQATAQPLQVHLQAGQEQQEGQAEKRQDPDGQVGLDPVQHRGTDHDPQDDLQHHCWEPKLREQAQGQRGHERHHRHDHQAGEGDVRHASWSASPASCPSNRPSVTPTGRSTPDRLQSGRTSWMA